MGKQHKKKTPRRKDCPTGLPSMRDIEKEEESIEISSAPTACKTNNSTITSIVEKLQSTVAEQREVGLCTLLGLLSDQNSIKPILTSPDLVKIVLCLLQDSSIGVKNAAAGVLRNLSAIKAEVSECLISEDVMTPLVATLHQYGMAFVPTITSDGKLDSNGETFLQLVHLMWNLCEASETAVNIFNKHGIVNLLSRCLDLKVFGNEIAIAVAQCLYSVSEDNKDCANVLSQPAMIQHFQDILSACDVSTSAMLLKTLICGILININESKSSTSTPPLLSHIFNVLADTISRDIKQTVLEIAGFLKGQSHIKGNVTENQEFQKLNSNFNDVCLAQQLALEILTNLCSSDDEDDEWGDIGSSDASDDVIDDAMECDAAKSVNEACDLRFISSEVHDAVIQHNLAAKVLQQSSLLEQDVMTFLSSVESGSELLSKFSRHSSRSLLCFHNLAMSLSIQELGGPSSVYQTWLQLAEQTLCPTGPLADGDLMEARSNVLRALINKLAENKDSLFEQLASSNIVLIIKESHKVIQDQRLESSSRVNIIRTLATLGSILIGQNGVNMVQAEPIVRDLGKFLLDALNKEQELWVLAETIDTIFDLFSEDYTDNIANQIGLVEKLKSALPLLKAKIKMQKKSLGSHYPVIITAKDNLPQFIKYKAARCQASTN